LREDPDEVLAFRDGVIDGDCQITGVPELT
jgi:hypothetical protein